MKKICSGLVGLFLAASPAWAVIGGGDIVFKMEGMASVLYSHDYHVNKARLKCSECHPFLYKNRAQHNVVGMASMQKGKSCGSCHNGKKAFDVADKKQCATCHNNKSPEN
ncbi:MAG: cytochrome c3 family protein [Nitrospirota bacterium]